MLERTVYHILLVEDNPLDVDLIQRTIQKANLPVGLDIARDGEEALAHLKRWDEGSPVPVVILLDLRLPRLSGLEVLKTIKTHPRYRILPVVVLTVSSDEEDIQRAYQLGANSYIVKSNDSEQFSNSVNSIHHYWCGLNVHPE
jgi:CheY-like chemotaxis protein